MIAPSDQVVDGFARRLKPDDYSLIESRCRQCGLIIVESVMDGLPRQEQEHLDHCPANQNITAQGRKTSSSVKTLRSAVKQKTSTS